MDTLRPPRCLPVLCLIAAAGLPLGLASAKESAPAPRTHVLYMGTDLSVLHGKKTYRVEDVIGSELKIRVDQQEVLVPTRWGPIQLHVDADLKISGMSVRLDELQSGPAYSYANDPMRKLEEANRNAAYLSDARDLADAAAPRDQANLAAVVESTSHYDSDHQAQAAREVSAAEWQLRASERQMASVDFSVTTDLTNTGYGANRAALAKFDAMEVSFKVSSPVELDRPYLVILFKFHDQGAKPGVDGLVIHAQALDPIDAKPRYVRVLKGGLPLGFKFVDCSVHLFNRGGELATNRSDKRVELTRDEARQYLVIEHCGTHKGATLPAAAVRGTLSQAQRQGLTATQRTRTCYAQVAKDGALLGVFADADCKVPLDDTGAAAALGEVFFAPALEQGKPVDGVARVRLADL